MINVEPQDPANEKEYKPDEEVLADEISHDGLHDNEERNSMRKVEEKSKMYQKTMLYAFRGDIEYSKASEISLYIAELVFFPLFVVCFMFCVPASLTTEDMATRTSSLNLAFAWWPLFWMSYFMNGSTIYVVDLMCLNYVLDINFTEKEKLMLRVAPSIVAATAPYGFVMFGIYPFPFTSLVVLQFFFPVLLSALGGIVYFGYMKHEESETLKALVIKNVMFITVVNMVCLGGVLGYFGLICFISWVRSKDVGNMVNLVLLMSFSLVKTVHLEAQNVLYSRFLPDGRQCAVAWSFALHSFFLAVLLTSEDSRLTDVLILVLLDFGDPIWKCYKVLSKDVEAQEITKLDENFNPAEFAEEMSEAELDRIKKRQQSSLNLKKMSRMEKSKMFVENKIHHVRQTITVMTHPNNDFGTKYHNSSVLVQTTIQDTVLGLCLNQVLDVLTPMTQALITLTIWYSPRCELFCRIGSSRFGHLALSGIGKTAQIMTLLLCCNFAKGMIVGFVCKKYYNIDLWSVWCNFCKLYGPWLVQAVVCVAVLVFGFLYEPWGCDGTFEFDWVTL